MCKPKFIPLNKQRETRMPKLRPYTVQKVKIKRSIESCKPNKQKDGNSLHVKQTWKSEPWRWDIFCCVPGEPTEAMNYLERRASCLMETWVSALAPVAAIDQLMALSGTQVGFRLGPWDGSPHLSHHNPLNEKVLIPDWNLGFYATLQQHFPASLCHISEPTEEILYLPCCVLGGLSPLLPEYYPAHGTKTFLSWTLASRTHPPCLISFALNHAGL